jgi:hypothetical protein
MAQAVFLFQGSLYLAAALPLLASTIAAYLWRGTVSRPWLFWMVGVVALYVLSILAVTWTFADVGLTGVRANQEPPAVDPFALHVYLAGLGLLVCDGLLLWGLRVIMAKR